ncbi:MAG: hypothetical protein L0G99_16290, partial [Propionibacteriales bacterium]|nr:hypothetical protein [Propionibacteriales bacterium]
FRTPARLTLARFRNEAGLLGAADLSRHALVEPPSTRGAGFWPGRHRLRNRLRRRLGGERAAG